jgi:hypothetical protein
MPSISEQLNAIPNLTIADCLQFFDSKATERDKAIADLAVDIPGEIEIDNSIVSEGDDNGAYVLAWTWVDFAGTPFDREKDE